LDDLPEAILLRLAALREAEESWRRSADADRRDGSHAAAPGPDEQSPDDEIEVVR
jgi:hypothetical protein